MKSFKSGDGPVDRLAKALDANPDLLREKIDGELNLTQADVFLLLMALHSDLAKHFADDSVIEALRIKLMKTGAILGMEFYTK